MPRMRATETQLYCGVTIAAGEIFDVREHDVKVLSILNRIAPVEEEIKKRDMTAEEAYKTRDMALTTKHTKVRKAAAGSRE